MFFSLARCTVHARSSIREPFGDLASVCFYTSSTFQHPPRNCIRPTLLSSSSMSGWMAEMAGVVDAASEKAPAPPMTKAAHPQSMMPSSIEDTPTEPATSPRMLDSQVREWPVELQLPRGEIGPREEPERFATRFILNDGRWTQQSMKNCCTKQRRDAITEIGIEKFVKQPFGRKKSTIAVWKNGKRKSKVGIFQATQTFHSDHLRKQHHLCVFFQKFTMLSGRMILPWLQGHNQSSRKLHRLQADRDRKLSSQTL